MHWREPKRLRGNCHWGSVLEENGITIQARRRGRPRRLSREAIVDAALAVLSEGDVKDFTMARVASRLSAGVMSLYSYFPTRDAMLSAVAENVFGRFEPPAPQENWRNEIREWLWATVRLFDAYPVALQLSAWDGQVGAAWLRTWLPVVKLIKRQGLEGARLAFATSWFSNASLGFITSQMNAAHLRRLESIKNIGLLERSEQLFITDLWFDLAEIDRRQVLEFGFDMIVKGLEAIMTTPDLPIHEGGA